MDLFPVHQDPGLRQAKLLEHGEEGVEVAGHSPEEGGAERAFLATRASNPIPKEAPKGSPFTHPRSTASSGAWRASSKALGQGSPRRPSMRAKSLPLPMGTTPRTFPVPARPFRTSCTVPSPHGHHPGPLGGPLGKLGGVARPLREEGLGPLLAGRLQDGPGKPPHLAAAPGGVHDDPLLHPRILRIWASSPTS